MLSVVGDAIPLHLDTRHSHGNFDTWVKETPPLYVVTEGLLLWLKGRYILGTQNASGCQIPSWPKYRELFQKFRALDI